MMSLLFLLLLVVLFILILIIGYVILIYNKLVTLSARIDNAKSQIEVQLKRRYDLIPNLVETVKGYAKHEKGIFENVTKARSAWQKAKTPAEKAKAENMLVGALKSLFAVVENYPTLKASENFKLLQEQLESIESKIAYARQFYNDSVLAYNNKIQMFPTNVFAKVFHFKPKEFFEIGEAERAAPKVTF